MNFNLTPEEHLQLERYISELKKSKTVLELALERYNGLLAAAEVYASQIAERLRDQYNEGSEDWVESDEAYMVDDFIGEWEAIHFPEIDGKLDAAEQLEALRTEWE